jgi:hypothetical protein
VRGGGRAPVLERLGVCRLDQLPNDPPAPLLVDRFHPKGHSILFGTGGSGKGTLASWWTVQLARAGHVVLIIDYEGHPDEWSRRITSLGPDARDAVAYVNPRSKAWNGTQGAIWDQAEDLVEAAEAVGATFVVIDSIVPACWGMEATKPETAAMYGAAIERIGLPTLSLAHVNRAGDMRYPFGSIFWHNLARVTWSAAKRDQDAGHVMELVMRKHNNGAKVPRSVVTVTYRDNLPVDVLEKGYMASMADLCWEALAEGPLTLVALVARLREADYEVKDDSVYRALKRGSESRPQRFTVRDQTWSRVADSDTTQPTVVASVRAARAPASDSPRTALGQEARSAPTALGQDDGQAGPDRSRTGLGQPSGGKSDKGGLVCSHRGCAEDTIHSVRPEHYICKRHHEEVMS